MTAPPPPLPPQPNAWHMYRAMVGIGMLCGLLIVTAFVVTAPLIARNRAAALQRAIFEVLPAARSTRAFLFSAGHLQPAPDTERGADVVYAGYDDAQRLVGVAIEGQGLGYQDVIRVLYGYAPERDAIVGIHVLESRETPGLGDRIESDPDFLRNFTQLDAALAAGGEALAHPIQPVKHGSKSEPWQVDIITGATISSAAVATILDASASVWVPRIERDLARLESPP